VQKHDPHFRQTRIASVKSKTQEETLQQVKMFQKALVDVGKWSSNKDVWEKCRSSQKKKSFTNIAWRAEVIRNLKVHNAVRSFAFKCPVTKSLMSKRKDVSAFKSEGYCTFSTCKVDFRFAINDDLQGYVRFQGNLFLL